MHIYIHTHIYIYRSQLHADVDRALRDEGIDLSYMLSLLRLPRPPQEVQLLPCLIGAHTRAVCVYVCVPPHMTCILLHRSSFWCA